MIRVSSRHLLLLASGITSVILTGCAMTGTSTLAGSGANNGGSATAATMKGNVHGGKQAIYNASVKLYAMNTGTAFYGDTATLYASTTTGFDGSFSFTKLPDGGVNALNAYACPAAAASSTPGSTGDPEMYLVATGGDTSGSIGVNNINSAYNNTAVKFILPIGDCESLSAATQVVMNEMTTVGSLVALQQFFNPLTEAIGAPSTNVTGLVNAIKMIPNLVDVTQGAAQSSVTPVSNVTGLTITATPESAKLNTISNILAACVSSTSGTSTACSALFNNAVPPGSSAPTNFSTIDAYSTATDTALALDYMLINPTESQDYGVGGKLAALYNLPTPSTAPYSPALATQPNDWTIGIVFVPSGTCPNPVSGGTAQPMLSSEYSMAIDKNGNIWMGGSGSNDTLSEVSPQGGAINCLTTAAAGNTAGRGLAIDLQGNIWWATNQGLLEYVLDPGNAAGVGNVIVHPQPTGGFKISGMAIDQAGNLYVVPDANTALSSIYEYVNAATATAAVTPVAIGGTANLAFTSGPPYRTLTATQAGYLVTAGSGGKNTYVYNPSTTTTTLVTVTGGGSTVYGTAEANDGTVYLGNTCCARAGGLFRINPTTATMYTPVGGLYAGGQNADRSLAIDGANNIWTGGATYANDPTGTLNSVGETDQNYNAISPKGITPSSCATTAGACEVLGGFSKPFFPVNSVYGTGIDASGNFWGTPDTSTAGQLNYFVIVGQAVPLKTPIVANEH